MIGLDRIPTEPANPGLCSFFDAVAAVVSAVVDFAAPAAIDAGATAAADVGATAATAGAADFAGAGAAGLGEAAAAGGLSSLGAFGAAGVGDLAAGAAGAAGAGEGIAGLGGLAGADAGAAGLADLGATAGAGLTDLGALGGAGTGALDAGAAGAAGIPTASALEAAPAAAGAAGTAIPAAGGVTAPLSALDAGSATGVLDTGGGGFGAAASDASLNPSNWLGFETVDPTTGAVTGGGTFPGGATAAPGLPAGSITTAGLGDVPAGTAGPANAATSALDTGGLSATGDAAPAASDALDAGAAGGKAGASGIGSTLGTVMSGLKTAAPLAPLALLGSTLIKGEPALPPQAQQLSGLGSSLGATGQQNLTAAANQQITAPQMSEISTWKQQQLNQLYQLYASHGQDPHQSSDYLQGVEQINAQAISMQQQFIDQLVQTGLGETGQATSALTTAANMQIQQDTAFNQSIASAIQAFGLTAGLSGLNINLSKAT
jgi:hypothetical protein